MHRNTRIQSFLLFSLLLFHGGIAMALEINSSEFEQNAKIPSRLTCDGDDISPAIRWQNAPEGTKSFALIFDDPDAPMGTWDHWLLFNIPANVTELAENIKQLPAGTKEGTNSWGRTGYGGPCPPDREHRYFFKLYALDTELSLDNGVEKKEIEKAMEGHILEQAELMGRYERVGQ